MTYSPRQQLFDKVYGLSAGLGFNTHLNNPDSSAEYPFVVIDPVAMTSRTHGKRKLAGRLNHTVHVWSLENEVGAHDQIMFELEQNMIGFENLETVYIELESIAPRTMVVTEGNDKLLHGIIQVTYKFY